MGFLGLTNRADVISVIDSEEGREALKKAIAKAAMQDFYGLLQEQADKLHRDLRKKIQEESVSIVEKSTTNASDKLQRASARFQVDLDREFAQVSHRFESYVDQLLGEQGNFYVERAVEQFVRRRPISSDGRSNKKIAHDHGISVRQVKKLRRSGQI
jgi:hypothetical protein